MKNSIHLRYGRASGTGRESGIALVMALLCLFVISTLAVGVMYSTQSEIWTTANYRATTQARYLAEAGAQQALNYLQSQFSPPADFTTNFTLTGMPVIYTASGKSVILATSGFPTSSGYSDTYGSGMGTLEAAQDTNFQNYFATAATQTPYAALTGSSGCSGSACPHFDVMLQLLTAVQGTDGKWLTRWKVISDGTLSTVGGSTARVQVVEVVDNVTIVSSTSNSTPNYDAAVFATNTGCNAITFSGGQYTNSYNSATQAGVTSPVLANTGGDVATFGNVSVTNGAYVIGNVFTPFYNVGTAGSYGISGGPSGGKHPPACSTASGGTEYAVNEDNSGSSVGCTAMSSGSCSQKTYALPSPAPSFPTPIMPTVTKNTVACAGYNGLCSGGSGGGSGCAITIPPSTNPDGSAGSGVANFGAVNFGSCAVITLQAGTYNMDSLLISNGAKVIVPSTGSVVINILDQGSTNSCNGGSTPLCVNGGTVANNGGDPSNLTLVYGGTKPTYVSAGANMFASVYAPNSTVTISGNAGIYGAVVANIAIFQGSGHVIYDTNLNNKKWKINNGTTTSTGSLHVDEFSWSTF